MRTLDPGRTVVSLAYDLSGRLLVAGCYEGVGLWDMPAGTERFLRIGHGIYGLGVCVSPDGGRIGLLENDTHVVRLVTSRVLGAGVRGQPGAFGKPGDHGFLADGRLLLLRPDGVAVYDPASTPVVRPCGPTQPRTALRVCPTGRWAAVHGPDGVRVYALAAGGQKWDERGSLGPYKTVDRLAFCGPGRLWLTAAGETRVWDCETAGWVVDGTPLPAPPLAVTPDGGRALVRTGDHEVAVIELAPGAVVRSFDWGAGYVDTAAVAPDGLTAAVAGAGGLIALFDLD